MCLFRRETIKMVFTFVIFTKVWDNLCPFHVEFSSIFRFFCHYWQEAVILTEKKREHQRRIAQALNQGFVFSVEQVLTNDI